METIEKLQLKHIAQYIPYGIRLMNHYGNWHHKSTDEYWKLYDMLNYKPILRPLSDLTKEIKHNGAKFIPLEILGQEFIQDGFFEDGIFAWGQPIAGGDEQDYSLTIVKEDDSLNFNIWWGKANELGNGYVIEETPLKYSYMLKLFEWHFDVDNLIEKELAININTL